MRLTSIAFALGSLALAFFAALSLRLYLASEADSVWTFERNAALVAAILFALLLAAVIWLWYADHRQQLAITGLSDENSRQRAELSALRAEMAAMLDDLEDGVLLCDTDHRVLLHNSAAAWLLEASGTAASALDLREGFDTGPLNDALQRLRKAIQDDAAAPGRHTTSLELTAAGNGALGARMAAVVSTDGQVAGYVLTLGNSGAERPGHASPPNAP